MISVGMRGRGVVPAAGGLLSGHLAATLVVAAGVGGIVAGTPLAMAALTLAGAGYLLWLDINMPLNPSRRRSAKTHLVALGLEERLCQRPEPEGLPAAPGTAATVHRPTRRLVRTDADRRPRPAACLQLRGGLSAGRFLRPGRAENTPHRRPSRQPRFRSVDDRHRSGIAGGTAVELKGTCPGQIP